MRAERILTAVVRVAGYVRRWILVAGAVVVAAVVLACPVVMAATVPMPESHCIGLRCEIGIECSQLAPPLPPPSFAGDVVAVPLAAEADRRQPAVATAGSGPPTPSRPWPHVVPPPPRSPPVA